MHDGEFLPRDATLARYMLSSCVRPFVRPSVCLPVCHKPVLYQNDWFLPRRLPSTYPTLCCKEIWVSPKIMALPSGTLFQTLDLENFATASRSRCQQNSSSQSSTVEFVDDTYTTIDESRPFTTSRSAVTL